MILPWIPLCDAPTARRNEVASILPKKQGVAMPISSCGRIRSTPVRAWPYSSEARPASAKVPISVPRRQRVLAICARGAPSVTTSSPGTACSNPITGLLNPISAIRSGPSITASP